jgi:hypothetical protein
MAADGNPNRIPREIRKGTAAIRIENGRGAGTPTLTRNVCVAKLRIAHRPVLARLRTLAPEIKTPALYGEGVVSGVDGNSARVCLEFCVVATCSHPYNL